MEGLKIMVYCPQCGSSRIDWILPQDRSKYECKNCGYIGVLVIQDQVLADEIRQKFEKNHLSKGE